MGNKYKKFSKSNPDEFFIAQNELDFHFYSSLNPAEIEKILYEFIEDSKIYGFSDLLVITGKGQVVKPIVRRLLNKHPEVKNFREAGYFNGQEGAFEVELS